MCLIDVPTLSLVNLTTKTIHHHHHQISVIYEFSKVVILSGCNKIQTHYHLICKQILNHVAKLGNIHRMCHNVIYRLRYKQHKGHIRIPTIKFNADIFKSSHRD